MARGYIYRRPVKRSHYSNFRRNLLIFFIAIIAAGAIAYFIYSGSRQPSQSATSGVTNSQVTGGLTTFSNDYFQFQDTGTWVIDKKDTSASRVVYLKYNKNVELAELIVYINQTPIPLYLAAPRVLPVRIVNDNSFQPTEVSNPCVNQYPKGALHRVQEVTISNATMLCDPDATDYFVILSEIGGDYTMNLKLSSGKPISFVITYRDVGTGNPPDSLLNIASSFKTR